MAMGSLPANASPSRQLSELAAVSFRRSARNFRKSPMTYRMCRLLVAMNGGPWRKLRQFARFPRVEPM